MTDFAVTVCAVFYTTGILSGAYECLTNNLIEKDSEITILLLSLNQQ